MKSRIDVIGQNGNLGDHYNDAQTFKAHDDFGIPEHLRSLRIRDDEPNDTKDVSTSSLDKLVDDHWKYIESVLIAHGVTVSDRLIAKFHYKTAFVHGYKHALEDVASE
jgi:hypothetical protein